MNMSLIQLRAWNASRPICRNDLASAPTLAGYLTNRQASFAFMTARMNCVLKQRSPILALIRYQATLGNGLGQIRRWSSLSD